MESDSRLAYDAFGQQIIEFIQLLQLDHFFIAFLLFSQVDRNKELLLNFENRQHLLSDFLISKVK